MEQTQTVQHFPSKMQHLTHKVTRLLSQKYKFADTVQNITINNSNQRQQPLSHPQLHFKDKDIEEAIERSDKMNIKLKLIRTMLGYDHQAHHRKINYKTVALSDVQKKDQRGMNLKQFVMSMRKRAETIQNYMGHRRGQSIDSQMITNAVHPENPNIQEYSESTLKYIHSFLPHQTLVDNLPKRAKRENHSFNITPNIYKEHSLSPSSYKIHNADHDFSRVKQNRPKPFEVGIFKRLKDTTNQKLPVDSIQEEKQTDQQQNNVQRSTIFNKSIQKLKMNQLSPQLDKKSNLTNYCQTSLDCLNVSNDIAPIQIYSNRVAGVHYRGKNYNRDLNQSIKNQRKLQNSGSSLDKYSIMNHNLDKQFLPVIRHYQQIKRVAGSPKLKEIN